MIQGRIIEEAAKLGPDADPAAYFGFTVWSHMVPWFKPKETLILGERAKQITALMRKVHGNGLSVTVGLAESRFKTHFDFVCVDMWEGGQPAKTIFLPEFADWLLELSPRIICTNVRAHRPGDEHNDLTHLERNLKDHGPFEFERGDLVGENVVLWWSVK